MSANHGTGASDYLSASSRFAAALGLLDFRTRLALGLLTAGRITVGLCDLLVAAAMYVLFLVLQGNAQAERFPGIARNALTLGAITAMLVISRVVLDSSTALFALRRIQNLRTELLLRLTKGYSQMQWNRFVERNRSELMNVAIHITRDAADFYHRWIELVASVAIAGIMMVAVIWKSPAAAGGIVLMLASVYLLHRYGLRGSLEKAALNRERSLRSLQRELADLLSCGKEIRTYRLHSFFGDRVRRNAQPMASADTRVVFLPQVARSIADQGAVLVFLSIIILIELRQGDVHQVLALLAFYFVLSRRLLPLTSQIAFIAGQMASSWENVRIVDAELRECSRYRISESSPSPPGRGYAIEFSRVSFSYCEDNPILSGVDFCLREGEIVALQGASGVGKSSLLNLITGLAQPQSGNVRCNPSEICYVPQEVPLLDDTIHNNLIFGLTGVSQKQLMDALTVVRLDQFVTALPLGLATGVGDNGSLLSGGQRQRLGLARALLRGGNTLLLDEATSALDEDSERQILKTLADSGKTLLYVTHRTSAHAFADRVLRLGDGRLAEDPAYLECNSKLRLEAAWPGSR